MSQSNKGYFLFDLLLSLSAILLIGTYLIPILVDLRKQEIQLDIENQARQIVYEEMHAKLTDELRSDSTTTRNGIVYQVYWTTAGDSKEVCVKVGKSKRNQKVEISGTLE